MFAAAIAPMPSCHRCGICDRVIHRMLYSRCRDKSISRWIEWILERPGHPEYAHVDFAKRYADWHRGGHVGPEPKYFGPPPECKPPLLCRRLVWTPVIAEIAAAQEAFKKLIDEGFVAHRVKRDGLAGSRMVRFDPVAEEVIFMRG